jgi:hypothetical protein
MFPVMFAIPRTGRLARAGIELLDDPEQKIARPRQLYVGAAERDYVPLGQQRRRLKTGGRPAAPRQRDRQAGARLSSKARRPRVIDRVSSLGLDAAELRQRMVDERFCCRA